MTYDTGVPVLILKIGYYVFHHGGAGIIRSLGRLGIPVYGVHEDRLAPAALSRYLCGKYVWHTGPDDPHLLERLSRIGRHLGRATVLIPTDDYGAIFIAEHAAALRPWFLLPDQPPALPRSVANKQRLYFLCKELGVPCPETCFPRSLADLDAFLDRAVFPVIAKNAESWPATSGGPRGTRIVDSAEALAEICRASFADGATQLMVQEFIPKLPGQDWIFHGYCDAQSRCLVSFTGVKLRSYPAFAGPTTLGESRENDQLRAEAEAMLKRLAYRGIMDLDYRLDPRDGRYKLLDFNPRVGANFRMFETAAGIDVVRAMHLDLTGRAPATAPMRRRRLLVENFDLLAAASYARAGELSARKWLSDLRSADETGWFAADDPLPFLVMAIRFFIYGLFRTAHVLPSQRRRPPGQPRFLRGRAHRRARRLGLGPAPEMG